MKGTLMFVLHSHIPFVRKKGKFPFGEEWIYEAIIDSYLPIIDSLNRLQKKEAPVGISLGLTPVLLEQIQDPYMIEEFISYVRQRINFCKSDYQKFLDNNQRAEAKLAKKYCCNYEYLLQLFVQEIGKDLAGTFKAFQDRGLIEIITSAATHGYLPLFKKRESIRLQLKLGVETYRKYFNREPEGIWLPECAFKPGLDNFLKEFGLKYFITDAHAIVGGKVSGVSSYGPEPQSSFFPIQNNTIFRPYQLRSGVSVLGRNLTTGGQVWSADLGYPGEGCYREFHKRDQDTGLQYWQITSKHTPLHKKLIYDPQLAEKKVIEHAEHFSSLVEHLLLSYATEAKEPGMILSPYDTELFGHWWHEGVNWLEKTIDIINEKQAVSLSTISDYLKQSPAQECIDLPECSWGAGGKHQVWLNENTEWIWKLLHEAEDRFWALKPTDLSFKNPKVREFLLLQSSDWPFLITTGQARKYAEKRVLEHWEALMKLLNN